MKKSIYYGNVIAHVLAPPVSRPFSKVTSTTLTFTGFDLSASESDVKLDLLFYNRVNEIGEVLSSLVYISNPLDLDDVSEKYYNVQRLYTNTDAERIMGLTPAKTDYTYLNCKWATSKYFTSSISPISDTQHTELAVNGIPSIRMQKYGVAFDGWYTQVSVGIKPISQLDPPVAPVQKGLLAIHHFSDIGDQVAVLTEDNPLNIDSDSVWSVYTYALEDGTVNPDDTILVKGTSLANLIVTVSPDNPYIKQELFVLPTYLDLYDAAVLKYAEEPTYGNPFPVLRDKHRLIHNYASENDFLEAQYIIQTTDYFRAVIQY